MFGIVAYSCQCRWSDFDKGKWAYMFHNVQELPLAHLRGKRRGKHRSSEGMKTAGMKENIPTSVHEKSDTG